MPLLWVGSWHRLRMTMPGVRNSPKVELAAFSLRLDISATPGNRCFYSRYQKSKRVLTSENGHKKRLMSVAESAFGWCCEHRKGRLCTIRRFCQCNYLPELIHSIIFCGTPIAKRKPPKNAKTLIKNIISYMVSGAYQ